MCVSTLRVCVYEIYQNLSSVSGGMRTFKIFFCNFLVIWHWTNFWCWTSVMFLLEKKVVTSLGKRRFRLVMWSSKSLRGRTLQSGQCDRGSDTQWLAVLSPGGWPCAQPLRCPQSPLPSQTPEFRLECEPLQVFWHQWIQGRLPSLTRPESSWFLKESLTETLWGLLGFLNVWEEGVI